MIALLKKKRVLAASLAILFLVCIVIGVIVNMALWGGDYFIVKVTPYTVVLDKAVALEKTGGKLQLREADLNGIASLLVKKYPQANNIQIKNIFFRLSEPSIELVAQAFYKGIGFMLRVDGTVSLEGGNLYFEPTAVRLGRLPLPPQYLLNKLAPYARGEVSILDNKIAISTSLIPFNISAAAVKVDRMDLTIVKTEETPANLSGETPSNQPQPSANSRGPSAAKESLLQRTSRQLVSVYSGVQTAGEKQVIARIQATVSNMLKDPAYPYQTEAGAVSSQYRNLSPDEQDDIKDALLTYMDTGTLKKLKSTFNL